MAAGKHETAPQRGEATGDTLYGDLSFVEVGRKPYVFVLRTKLPEISFGEPFPTPWWGRLRRWLAIKLAG